MPKATMLVMTAGALFLLGAVWIRGQRSPADAPTQRARSARKSSIERFSPGSLDPTAWVPFRVGDFRASAVEMTGCLRLAADTRGTPPGAWKHLGVRRAEPIPIRDGTEIGLEIDWVEKADASYLSAALVLSPHAVSGNPRSAPDWVEISYAGAQSGVNARIAVGTRENGVERNLLEEGRTLSRRKIWIRFQGGGFELRENGEPILGTQPGVFPYATGYLYLMLSSESNYALREVRFGEVEVRVP